jgi:hypothetical protein
MAEKCQAGCRRDVVYRWLRPTDAEGFDLCATHSANSAKKLTDMGFDMWLVESEDEACTGG